MDLKKLRGGCQRDEAARCDPREFGGSDGRAVRPRGRNPAFKRLRFSTPEIAVPDTCVLRFRDIEEDDTIREHRQLISASGSVWWGWWKKLSEPDRWREIEELQEKVRREGLAVGGFEYSTPGFFFANMVDCIATKGSERVPTPDVRYTPSYASEKRCPAWFRFTAIEEVSATA